MPDGSRTLRALLRDVAATGGTFIRNIVLAALAAPMTAGSLGAQTAPVASGAVPFAVGEDLVYRASLGRFGGAGSGTMRVEATEEVRGRQTYRLHADLRGRVMGLGAQDHSESWLDPVRMTSLRFVKRERNPLSSFTEAVELYPERGRWVAAAGDSGALATDAPLDELSFIYFVRTLPLADGDEYVFDRHYDAARNPTRVRVVARERVAVPAGEFRTIVVEMRVRDARRFDDEGTIRLHLTDDARRVPVRIASSMRLVGATVLSLESMTLGAGVVP